MSTPYQRLTRLREKVMALRAKLPVSSADAGELLTEFVDLIDTALLDVVKPEEKDEDAKATTAPLTLADELWEFGCAMSRVHMGVTAG